MSEMTNVTMSAEELLAAGKTLGINFSPISPFWMEGGGSPPAALMQNDALRPDLLPAFQTLAEARRMGACAYLCAEGLMDTSFYYSTDGKPSVSLSMTDDGVRLQAPAAIQGALLWLAEHAGDSLKRACGFEAQLSAVDAHVLFGLVDAARRKALAGIAGQAQNDPTRISLEELENALADTHEDDDDELQWMAPHFAAGYELKSPETHALQKSLQQLVHKKYAVLEGKEVVLGDALTDLASVLLLVEGHLRLRTAEVDKSDKVRITEVKGVRGQGSALLLWTDDGKIVHLRGTSPAQALAIARDMFVQKEDERFSGAASASASTPAAFQAPAASQASGRQQKERKKLPWWGIALIVLVGSLLVALLLSILFA